MEKKEESGGRVMVVQGWWLWAAASTAQLGYGIRVYTKGHAGDSHLMPFKAFIVASLFVGAAGTAAVASLRANGVYSVKDMKSVGANIRMGLGLQSRVRDE